MSNVNGQRSTKNKSLIKHTISLESFVHLYFNSMLVSTILEPKILAIQRLKQMNRTQGAS